jgi:hypothetical protein
LFLFCGECHDAERLLTKPPSAQAPNMLNDGFRLTPMVPRATAMRIESCPNIFPKPVPDRAPTKAA